MLDLLMKPWMASCQETGARISDYVDRELEGRNLTRVSRHLARCKRCQAMLESLQRTLEQLRSLGSPEQVAPEAVTVSAVLSRIRHDKR
jgi:anti-sigma factor RsiW